LLTNLAYPEPLPELTHSEPPPLPEGVSEDPAEIKVFCHPDVVVCPPANAERVGNMVPLVHIDCVACGTSSIADDAMRGKHLVCPHCGHYVFGMDFRERFPLKQFVARELVWQYRRKTV
jgi:DNA-directed RNA polymerase subunit RPC12/RpoP